MNNYKIKDLGIVITGYTPSTKNGNNYNSNDYMFVGPSDIKNNRLINKTEKHISNYAFTNSTKRILHNGDVVVDCIGSDMGNVGIITDDCISNQQINAITNINNQLVDNYYLYYLLSTKKEFLHSIGMNGSTMPIISKSLFENIELSIHSQDIQQHIVDTIGSIDDLIEKYQLILDKQTLFERNLIKKENNVNTTKLKENIKFVKGKKPTEMLESGVKYLSIDVLDGSTELFANPEKTIIANNNDVLMVMDGASSGKVFIGNEGIVGSTLAKIEAANINSYYLYLFLKNNYSFISEHNTGSAIPHTNKELVCDLDIPNSKFRDELYNNLLNKRIYINNTINKLNKLKQLYLKKFFG